MYFRVDERQLQVVGLKVHKYVGKGIDGEDCEFEEFPIEAKKYIITVKPRGSAHQYIEIELSETNGECYSGYCTAVWGEIAVRSVDHPRPFTHVPKDIALYLQGTYLCYIDDAIGLVTDLNASESLTSNEEDAEIYNNVFSFSSNGGDYYYPMGEATVNMDLFNRIPRAMNGRPVYIVYGKSGVGKSSIFNELEGSSLYSLYETDCSDTLPEVITQNIVILGNKHGYSIEDVKAHLFGEPEVHLIHFE